MTTLLDPVRVGTENSAPESRSNQTEQENRLAATEPAASPPKTKHWKEVADSSAYRSLSSDEQEIVRNRFFDTVVAPMSPPDELDLVRERFDSVTGSGKVGRVAHDAGRLVAAGAHAVADQAKTVFSDAFRDEDIPGLKNPKTPTRAQNLHIPAEGRALLDTLAGTESPGYDVLYGGTRFGNLTDHPRKPIRIQSGPNQGQTSTAAGRYQFLEGTWDDQAQKLGLKDFSPESQDQAAWNLAQETYANKTGRSLLGDLRSNDPKIHAEIGKALSSVWTSLPGGIEATTNENRFAGAFRANLGKEGQAFSPELFGAAVKPGFIEAVRAKYDAASPAERARMINANDVEGRVARYLDTSYREADDAMGSRLAQTGVGTRREDRVQTYIDQGYDHNTAAKLAGEDIHLGRPTQPAKEDDSLSLRDVYRRTGSAALAGLYGASEGLLGSAEAGAGALSEYLTGPLADRGILPEDTGARIESGIRDLRQGQTFLRKKFTPQADNDIARGFYSGIQSLVQNGLLVPAAIATDNPNLLLGPMTAMTAGSAYGESRDEGANVPMALTNATAQGLIEYGTEVLPVGYLLKDIKAGSSFMKVLTHQLATEVPAEQVATSLQDLMEWATLHPEKTGMDYLKERPSAINQTLVATLVGVGGQVTLAKGAELALKQGGASGPENKRSPLISETLQSTLDSAHAQLAQEAAGTPNAITGGGNGEEQIGGAGGESGGLAGGAGVLPVADRNGGAGTGSDGSIDQPEPTTRSIGDHDHFSSGAGANPDGLSESEPGSTEGSHESHYPLERSDPTPVAEWDRLTPEDREKVIVNAGWGTKARGANPFGKKLVGQSWSQIRPDLQSKLSQSLTGAETAPAGTTDAPLPSVLDAQTEEASSAMFQQGMAAARLKSAGAAWNKMPRKSRESLVGVIPKGRQLLPKPWSDLDPEHQQRIAEAFWNTEQEQQNLAATASPSDFAVPRSIYDDPRMKREVYRSALPSFKHDLVKGGDVSYVRDEHGTIIGRTPSVNPDWFKNLPEDLVMTVDQVKQAIDKAMAGKPLGVRQERLIGHLLDQIGENRTAPNVIDLAKERRKEIRSLLRAAKNQATLTESDVEQWLSQPGMEEMPDYGFILEEEAYDPEAHAMARTLSDLAREAIQILGDEKIEALLDSPRSDTEIMADLWRVINGRTRENGPENAQGMEKEPAQAKENPQGENDSRSRSSEPAPAAKPEPRELKRPKVTAGPQSGSTAPEHAGAGVDDRELGEIVEEFNRAQQASVENDQKVTHIFDAPTKGEIVRLGEKVKVYNKDHGWMTPAEAKVRIAEWQAHAKAQGKDKSNGNSERIVLSLFDLTGSWSAPWEEAGYQVYRFDIQDDPEFGDVNKFGTEFFNDTQDMFEGRDIYAILAACPCTDFASSGARHFAAKDSDGRTVASVKLVHQTLATIEYFKPAIWAVENPVGRIEKLGGLPPWRLSFDPNHIGDPYTKKTLLWGRFNADLPIAPVEPTEGSKMHKLYGGKSLATKNARSATPEGFAYGFFAANNAIDHPVMAIANRFDRLNRSLIEKAVDAGITEEEIAHAVEDFYYQDLDDVAANQSIQELIDAKVQPATEAQKPTEPPEKTPANTATRKKRVVSQKTRTIPEKIEDLGEKIGGARKDDAISTGPRRKSAVNDETPTWARRYEISQIVAGPGEGRWVIRDKRQKDRFGQAKMVGGPDNTYESQEAAQEALPLTAVALKHKIIPVGPRNDNGDQPYEIWREINDRKRVKVVSETFLSRRAAMEYMVQHARAILETNTTFGEADLPTPDRTNRTGAERRQGDVEGRDFMETFGFRGVEFGNWNNQIERQEVMNAAYDGLMDLAEVMAIPPEAIGLNGDLALAFGARGQGLTSAKAHYERDRSVINLTKMNGAGALAHEWFHALDHYLGRQDGKASGQWQVLPDGTKLFKVQGAESDMASGGFKRNNSGVREELRTAYNHIIDTLLRKAETYVDDTLKADAFVATSREEVARRLTDLRNDLASEKNPQYYKRHNKPASAEQLAAFDTVAQQILAGEALEIAPTPTGNKSVRLNGMRWSNAALEQLSSIYKAVRGRSGFDSATQSGVMDRLRNDMTRYSGRLKLLASAQSGEEKTRKVPTEFAMNAKELDQGRGTDYWTTPHEMAARAFQGFVEDRIAAQGASSPFLNYAPERAGIMTPWGFKQPFPAGEERKAINRAFEAFVKEIKTKKTESGTLLFRRPETLLRQELPGERPDAKEAAPVSADQSKAKAINRVLARHFKIPEWENAYVQRDLPESLAEFAEATRAAFGTEVVGITPSHERFDQFNGINYEGVNYVNLDSKIGFIPIAGHELLHQLKKDRPDLYQWFAEQARGYYKDFSEYQSRLNAIAGGHKDTYDREAAEEELLGDFVGDALADPVFAQQLAEANPGKFKKLFNAIVQWLKEVSKKLAQQGLGSSRYFSDVEALRKHLEATLNAYAQGGPVAVGKESAPRFSTERAPTRRPTSEQPTLSRPVFYSSLERGIETAKVAAQPAAQWLAWVRSNAAPLGIKHDEMLWSGLEDYLTLKGKAKLSKTDVLAFVKDNGVEVNEVLKGEGTTRRNLKAERNEEGSWRVVDPQGQVLLDRASEIQAMDFMVIEAERKVNATKYDEYTLPGGQNYRELLITLPEATDAGHSGSITFPHAYQLEDFLVDLSAEGYADLDYGSDDARGAVEFNGLNGQQMAAFKTLAERNHGIMTIQSSTGTAAAYASSHWSEPNILAHIRFNDRTDTEGDKVLFIEEIQSDWAQEGRKKGFALPKAEHEKLDSRRRELETLGGEARNRGEDIASEIKQEWADIMNRIGGVSGQGQKVPPAPFVKDTKAWVTLALKRIIRYAAEGGYDKVAFVNGVQSADRYSLSKAVNHLRWGHYPDGGRMVMMSLSDNTPVQLIVDSDAVVNKSVNLPQAEGKPLDEVVGKDLATKIMSEKVGTLHGVGLDIGGEGMKSFYDKIVPQIANDVLKKLGGGRMESVTLRNTENDFDADALDNATPQELARLASGGVTLTQPGFVITDALRSKSLEGVPLFSRRNPDLDPEARALFEDIDTAIQEAKGFKEFQKELDKRWDEMTGTMRREALGALKVDQLAEIAAPLLPRVKDYIRNQTALDVTRNQVLQEVDALAKDWERLDKLSLGRLASVMHEATLAGVDPAVDYVPSIDVKEAGKQIGILKNRMRGAGGDPKIPNWMAEVKQLRAQIQFEKKRLQSVDRLTAMYAALSAPAQTIYNRSRDYHMAQSQRVEKALTDMIQKSKLSGRQRAAAIASLRKEFESQRVQAPYFPLGRQGDYWIYVAPKLQGSGAEGEREFHTYQTIQEQEAALQGFKARGLEILGRGKQLEGLQELQGVPASFVADVENMIGQLGDGPEIASVRDQIYQLYLRSLPDLSARKHFIHRKKTPGFGKDALRAFAVKGYHDAYQYARIKHAFDLRRTMEALSEDIKTATSKPAQKALAHQEKRLRAFQEEVLEAGLTTKEVKQRAAELNQAMETMQDARGDKALSAGEKFLVAEAAQWKQFAEWMRDWAKYGGLPDWIQQQIKDIEVRFDTLRRINRKKRGYEQATNYHGELQAAYAHLMNPSSGRWANLLNQYGYLGHLALSPAAWITNATQTPLITIPYVAARYGSTQTYAAFGKAMQEALRGAVGGQKEQALGIREALTRPDEIEAHTAGLERGIIQHGRAMDLAGLAEEGASRSGWHRKFALAMTFGFHHAELLNREVSFMASYRLARDAGVSPSEAIDYAAKVVNDTHFNYSAENRPRFLRGDLMRVLGQFKLYSQSLTYLVWRNVHQSLSKDATPEERREARRFLLHMSAMQMAAAGAMGLPIGVLAAYGVGAGAIKAAERAGWKGALAYTAMVIGAAVGLGGDDPDDPKAWESEFRQIMNDWLGAKGGEAVSRGLVNTLVGIDLSTRVSQSELWWRSLDADLSDKAWWGEVLSQVAGPSIGTIATLVQGMQMAAEGHVWRGIEKAVPKAVKDPMQALRFALEGAQTLKGDPLIETFTPWEIAAKASGFQPSRLSERYQENSAEKDREHKIEDRRKDLTRIVVEARESTAKALNAGEASQRKAAEADFEAAIRDVERFNTKNPRYAITGPSILRSAQSRASARQKAQHGIFVNPKIPRRYDFAGDEAQD